MPDNKDIIETARNFERTFTESLREPAHLPHNDIVNSLDEKSFPFMTNWVFTHKTGEIAAEEYLRCLDLFARRSPEEHRLPTQRAVVMSQMRLQPVMNYIAIKEMPHHDSLKEIAVDTVRSLFDIPEHVKLLPEFDNDIEMDTEQDDSEEALLSLSQEEQMDMDEEIQKRIIMNGLVHGSAMHIWKSAHYIIKDKIDELDGALMDLYNDYTSNISWLLWQMPPAVADGNGFVQGFNELEFDEDEDEDGCTIKCKAINFSVLLHEITKGAMDYLTCHGIPEEYNEEQLKYYYAKADAYEDEIWHYLLSPTLWTRLIEAASVSTQELPAVIAGLAKLDYNELIVVMTACIDSPEQGNLKLKELKFV